MAQNYGPKISTLDLILNIDPSNNKSYPAIDLPVKNGLLVWLDASDDTTFSYSSGTEVSQWRDKSGNNFHANQSLSSAQPSRSTFNNSRKSVNFVAANAEYFLISATPNLALPGDASIFIVYKPATQSNVYAVLLDNYHGQGGNYGFVIQRVNNLSQFYYANADSSGFIDTAASPWTYTDNVIQLLSLNKLSTTGTPYISGTAQTSRSVRAATAQATTGLVIGTWGQGGRNYNGDMCEILIFNRSLDSTEMKKVHTYLGQKWGIVNTDRQIFDLTENGFNFAFNGTNPRYNAKTIVSNFNSSTPFAVSSYGGQNLTNAILNLLYVDHTIEVAVNLKGFKAVESFDNARDYEGAAGIVLWQGYHGGLYVDAATQKLTYLIWNATPDNVYIEYALPNDLKDKILYITAKRQANVLSIFINGLLVAGPTSITTTVRSYTQINIGAAFQGDPSSGTLGSFVWAGQHEYHLLRMYSRALDTSELVSNYQAFKARFDNNIVRFGLVLDLDAGNPLSYAGAGTTWYDVSGNSFNATLINSPTYISDNGGVLNWASANSQYATVPMSSTLRVASITQEVWVYLSSTADQVFIGSQYGTSSNNSFALWIQSGTFYFGVNVGGTFYTSTSSAASTSTWYHLVHTYNGTTQYLYINGVLTTTFNSAASGNISYDTSNTLLAIGADFNGTGYNVGPSVYTNGKMPVVRIYNIALSAAQVLQNYNATKGRFGL